MNTLKRIVAALRIALGWGALSETRPSPAHGWLLRTPAELQPLPVREVGRRR